jgi:serine/threonine protein kinase
MGSVYRARDTRLARDVALKVLLPEFARDPERLVRFDWTSDIVLIEGGK